MNPLLPGLAIPAALSAPRIVARTVHTIVSPFADALQAALGQMSGEEGTVEIASGDADRMATDGLSPTQDPHLALLGKILTGQPPGQGETGIELAEVRTRADLLRDDLQRRLTKALSSVGIVAGLEVRLQVNPDDASVEVVGNHPQQAVMESLFAGDPQLSQDFRRLTAMGQLLRAADTQREFAEMYARDPWHAVARFPELFAGAREALFTVSPSGSEARLDFDFPSART